MGKIANSTSHCLLCLKQRWPDLSTYIVLERGLENVGLKRNINENKQHQNRIIDIWVRLTAVKEGLGEKGEEMKSLKKSNNMHRHGQ